MSVELHPHFLYDEEGKPKLVLLSYEEYSALADELEDAADASTLAERIRLAGTPIPLADLLAEFTDDK